MTDDSWDDFKKTLPNALVSLPEYVLKVVDTLGVESEEFKDLVKSYGKEKLRDLYKKGKNKS